MAFHDMAENYYEKHSNDKNMKIAKQYNFLDGRIDRLTKEVRKQQADLLREELTIAFNGDDDDNAENIFYKDTHDEL